MERRLLRGIINPAMISTLGFGIILVFIVGKNGLGTWFHIKLTLLIVMFFIHGMLSKYRKAFIDGKNSKSKRFFRILNEIPAVLMICIVILAVLKPF